MRRHPGNLLLLVVAAVASGCAPSTPGAVAPESFEVAYLIDGDTLDVTDTAGEIHRVRLLGIDAPEVAHDDQPGEFGGEAATDELRRLLREGETVQLLTDSRADGEDQYGRLLRNVQTEDGTDAAAALLEAGHAHAWTPRRAGPRSRGHLRGCQRSGPHRRYRLLDR